MLITMMVWNSGLIQNQTVFEYEATKVLALQYQHHP